MASRYDISNARAADALLGDEVTIVDVETGEETVGVLVGWSMGTPRWLVKGGFDSAAYATDLEAGSAEIVIDKDDEFLYKDCVWADVEDGDYTIKENNDDKT